MSQIRVPKMTDTGPNMVTSLALPDSVCGLYDSHSQLNRHQTIRDRKATNNIRE